ncbi:MAG: lipocalin family protein [Verrucomicrobiota bacterium]
MNSRTAGRRAECPRHCGPGILPGLEWAPSVSLTKPISRHESGSLKLRHAALVVLGLGLTSCSPTRPLDAPATATRVELSRYTGRWFEIARLPMAFQKADEAAIAEYGANADGTVSVHNIAIRPDGTQHDIRVKRRLQTAITPLAFSCA